MIKLTAQRELDQLITHNFRRSWIQERITLPPRQELERSKTMKSASKSILLSLIATAGLYTLAGQSAEASIAKCTSGKLVGRYALKSKLNGKYVRGGIGSGSFVGAKSNRIGGNTSWETFDIYDLGNLSGLNGGTYALRSTQDSNRWVSVNNSKKLQLMGGCNSRTRNRLFVANKIGNTLQLQSLANQQWVIQRSNNMLNANALTAGGNVPRALQFAMVRQVAPTPAKPTPRDPATGQIQQPRPQVNLNGWFRGNNRGIYSAQRSGNQFQMKGFINNKPFNLITGNITGNVIRATWKNFCNNSTGSLRLRIEQNRILKIGGSPGFNTSWTPTQSNSGLSGKVDCNNASNLTGTWRGNKTGTYVIRQTGNIVSWSGKGGNFRNIFVGQRQGNTVTGYWQDTASSSTQNSGKLVFRVQGGSKLVKVSNTGALGNTSWSR